MAQARDDRAVATRLYLQSRATALRVEKRKEEEARRAGVVEALSREPDPRMAPTGAPQAASAAPAPQGVLGRLRSGMGPNRRHLMLIAGAVGAVVVAAGAFLALRSGSPPPAQTSAAKPASTAPAASARAIKRQETPPEDFAAKVRAMKDAGNWNLLVINAAEWTRRQPTNRDAWKELSLGYVQLRQWNDALDATKKAVEVAPDDLLMWQTLGQVYVNLRRPVEALEAFQRATALNERDVGSWVQQGLLNIQLRRLPDAKAAFERALAVSPGDAEALCGQVTIAQKEEREKDAAALTRQVASQGSSCPEPPPLQTSIVKGDRAVDSSKVGRKPH
jgi:Flp pilus assembly protein TadD